MGNGDKTTTNAAAAAFSCPACGRRYVWKAQWAGRQAKCKCGAEMTYPAQPPEQNPPADDLYDLTPPVAAPVSQTPAAPVVLSYQSAKVTSGSSLDTEKLMAFQAPLWILCGGVVAELLAKLLFKHDSLNTAAIDIGLGLIVGTAVQLAAMLVAAKFRGIDLGQFGPAVLKLAAVSVAPGAVFDLFLPLLNIIPLGGLIGVVGVFVLYFALLGMFFDLDQSDTWYCVMVMFIVGVASYLLVQHFV